MNSRATIEQAKGALAERAGIGMDEAFQRLRSYARSHHDKLTDVAEALVARTLTAVEIDTLIGAGYRTQSDAAS